MYTFVRIRSILSLIVCNLHLDDVAEKTTTKDKLQRMLEEVQGKMSLIFGSNSCDNEVGSEAIYNRLFNGSFSYFFLSLTAKLDESRRSLKDRETKLAHINGTYVILYVTCLPYFLVAGGGRWFMCKPCIIVCLIILEGDPGSSPPPHLDNLNSQLSESWICEGLLYCTVRYDIMYIQSIM